MNTLQLARHAARHLAVPDPSDLGGDALLDVLSACNAGLRQFYREAPAILKRTTLSATFREPAPISLRFSAKYSNYCEGDPFACAWLGCGLRLGHGHDNEITGTNTVLDDWLSDNLEATGQVLFDTATLPCSVERMVSAPRLYTGGSRAVELRPDREGLIERRRDFAFLSPALPTHYKVDAIGGVLGGQITSLLRIHPAPPRDCTVRFEAEMAPLHLTGAHLATPIELPILNAHAEELLVPLVEAALTTSPLWRSPATIRLITDRATEVLLSKIPRLTHIMAPADHTISTPSGF